MDDVMKRGPLHLHLGINSSMFMDVEQIFLFKGKIYFSK